jgi:Nif-specific regulatory protein
MTAKQWSSWSEIPWRTEATVRLADRLLHVAIATASVADFLKSALPDLLVEYGGTTIGLLTRESGWSPLATAGREWTSSVAPSADLLAEVLDREAGIRQTEGRETLLVVPVDVNPAMVLTWRGERVAEEVLPAAVTVGRLIGVILSLLTRQAAAGARSERLRQTLQLAQAFSREKETLPLLELMARRATEMLGCDRASIFIWDREQRQLAACPALGVEGGRLWLPDDKGIVGEVIQTGRSIRVDDAYADSRFDQSVDRASGFRTRNLLCVPMVDSDRRVIGAFELINKREGSFTESDCESLEALCIPAAIAVQYARERDQLVRSNQQLTQQVTGQTNIIGESAAIVALRGTISRLAATDLPVLILGESGSGKEVAAQALHLQGPRAAHPFIAVNCAALTETLLESELFGHEKGAFTDAHQMRSGKFELADGGTLFLDEIGDMSPGGQAKLLRVLEQKVITRVGGSQSIPINVRVIAATNSNLAEAVRDKRFRQDLYYRLSVVTVDLPPLRERPEDVQPLARYFLEQFCRQAKRRTLEISVDARRRLQAHAWPGNVRELRNLMERVAFLTRGDVVDVDDLAFILAPRQSEFDELGEGVGLSDATDRFQKDYIRRAVKRVQGNMSEAARLLGLHRSNLYRKMRQLGMEVDDAKE